MSDGRATICSLCGLALAKCACFTIKSGVCMHGTHWSKDCSECGIWRVYQKTVGS